MVTEGSDDALAIGTREDVGPGLLGPSSKLLNPEPIGLSSREMMPDAYLELLLLDMTVAHGMAASDCTEYAVIDGCSMRASVTVLVNNVLPEGRTGTTTT